MVGFVLKNTLSENGGVTRGLCRVDENNMLTNIVETHNIEKKDGQAVICTDGECVVIDAESPVSMNMWGLTPEFFDVLQTGFETFLENVEDGDLKAEYLLPTLIGELLEKGRINVKVLHSGDQWFGVTYKEDREAVVNAVNSLVKKGLYPERLFAEKR